MSSSRFCYLVVIVCLLIFSGCDSASENRSGFDHFAVEGGAAAPPMLDGMVFLGRGVPGVAVEARDKTGKSLARTTTDSGGFFHFDGIDDSMQLTLSATLPGSDFELLTLVDPADGEDFPVIGIPSTLITRRIQSSPGESWPTAEDWFSRLVGASTAQNWGSFLDESEEMPFSHLGFFAYAASQGGIESTVSSLLAVEPQAQLTDEESFDPLFDLEYEHFAANLGGLDSAYLELANAVQSDEGASFSSGSSLGSLLRSIGEGVAGSIFDGALEWGWTWIVSSMSQNDGPDIASIQGQLDAFAGELDALSQKVDKAHFQAAAAELNTEIASLLTINDKISRLAKNARLSNEPFTPPETLQQLLNTLASYQVSASLLRIQNYMLGTYGQTNILALTLKQKMEGLGVDQQPHFMNMPLRSNAILNDVLRTYNLYAGYQTLACDLLAELSHNANNPVDGTNFAVQEIALASASLKRQRSQLPQPLPSEMVLADLENGLMWYLDVIPRKSRFEAEEFAKNFRIQGAGQVEYRDWRLPNENELRSLRRRGQYANSTRTSAPEGFTVFGLGRLDFQGLDRLANTGQVWCGEIDWYGKWYGFKLNEESDWSVRDFNDSQHCSILVRSIGESLYQPYHKGPTPATPNAPRLQDGEAAALGAPVNITEIASLRSQNRLLARVEYAVAVGGGFHYGVGGQRERFDLSASRKVVEVLPDRNASFAYESLSSELRVLNLPGRDGNYLWKIADAAGPEMFVTVRASILGYRDGGVFPAEVTHEKSLSLPFDGKLRTLASIRIFPKNRQYTSRSTVEKFTAVGSYSDGSVADLTNEVDWSVTAADGSAPVSGASFTTSPQGILRLNNPEPPHLVLKAKQRGSDKSDETRVQVPR